MLRREKMVPKRSFASSEEACAVVASAAGRAVVAPAGVEEERDDGVSGRFVVEGGIQDRA
jgi:hypothetical protein